MLVLPLPRAERLPAIELLCQNLSAVERKLVRMGPGRLTHIFGAPDLDTYLEILRTEWFDAALESDRFTIYFQPIVDVTVGRPLAYECLIRLEAERIYNGGEIVNAAQIRNRILDFDNYARDRAIRSAAQYKPEGVKLFVNFFPSAMYDPAPCLRSTIDAIRDTGLKPGDVVFEIIECDPLTNPDHTRRICDFFRAEGFSYAIDDLGIGTNTIDMIPTLKPNFIKVDKSVIWNLSDPARRDMLARAVLLARDCGAQIIAEGIESLQHVRIVRDLGIHLMQGYCFGKPSPVMRSDRDSDMLRDLLRLSEVLTSSSAPARVPGLASF
jgi:EAL domain-containing protein (putative c-di-GMP-specific phosphodiesterase class I)